MNQHRYIFLILILLSQLSFAQVPENSQKATKELPFFCLSWAEIELYEVINKYRNRHNLPDIPLSASLTYVAQVHAKDLAEHYDYNARCNLHSWSDNGTWSSCCYSSDHKESACMWMKPEELTGFTGYGYEIAYWNSYDYANQTRIAGDALKAWKKSRGHNNVIINRSTWKDLDWKAMGIGIYEGYVLVWFSDEVDDSPEPGICVE